MRLGCLPARSERSTFDATIFSALGCVSCVTDGAVDKLDEAPA
jgi:hypothetical protein